MQREITQRLPDRRQEEGKPEKGEVLGGRAAACGAARPRERSFKRSRGFMADSADMAWRQRFLGPSGQASAGGSWRCWERRSCSLMRRASSSWSSRMMIRQAASMGVPWLTRSRARMAMRSW